MLKQLKESMNKDLKQNRMTSHQIENVNKKILLKSTKRNFEAENLTLTEMEKFTGWVH